MLTQAMVRCIMVIALYYTFFISDRKYGLFINIYSACHVSCSSPIFLASLLYFLLTQAMVRCIMVIALYYTFFLINIRIKIY
jgi:hypothetical protein